MCNFIKTRKSEKWCMVSSPFPSQFDSFGYKTRMKILPIQLIIPEIKIHFQCIWKWQETLLKANPSPFLVVSLDGPTSEANTPENIFYTGRPFASSARYFLQVGKHTGRH